MNGTIFDKMMYYYESNVNANIANTTPPTLVITINQLKSYSIEGKRLAKSISIGCYSFCNGISSVIIKLMIKLYYCH